MTDRGITFNLDQADLSYKRSVWWKGQIYTVGKKWHVHDFGFPLDA